MGVVNQIKGGVPEPRFFFGITVSRSPALCSDIAACFLSKALNVVSFRFSSSSSESDESEPERLSSRSGEFQSTLLNKTCVCVTSYKPFKFLLGNSRQPF